MSVLIYLRHGDDRGDDVYRHDRQLNDRGRKKARKAADRLIEKHGHPDHVFVSPYRRALGTLDAMSECFERAVEVHRDPRIAQRLSAKQRESPSISPETLAFIALDEDMMGFHRRVADHVEEARNCAVDAVVWCITHQVVVEVVAAHLGVDAPSKLDFLDHVVAQR